ncbi:hypothetical protein MMC13_007742 [Lambiella insularis]|nr:hypothetical protein [Lambiella insularis]
MASTIPTALKSADITRFAIRAAQVEKAKPVIGYWCNYWIVNQILAKGLHTSNDESTTYTMGLMDKLEQTKLEHSDDDAITDDVAGQAYVEQFGLETFQRAENAIRANKVTRQTADTFQAAATFLELDHIWGEVDPEIASKIKYAKFHALRIAKALKAGEDPNLSNPAPDPPLQGEQSLDPDDPDVMALDGRAGAQSASNQYYQPSVEEIPDEHDRLQHRMARTSSLDQSLHPSRAPSVPPASEHVFPPPPPPPPEVPSPQTSNAEIFYHSAPNEGVSPLASSNTDGRPSDGGGYFPSIPNGHSDRDQTPLYGAQFIAPGSSSDQQSINAPSAPSTSSDLTNTNQPAFPQTFPTHPGQASQHIQQPPSCINPPQSQAATKPMHPPPATFMSHPPAQHPQPPPAFPVPQQVSAQRYPSQSTVPQAAYLSDEEAIMKSQKHARWAISALNFEDVNTAVKELKAALQSLGAA